MPEDTKYKIGMKYANYAVNNYTKEANLGYKFLEIGRGLAYIPTELKIAKIDASINNLLQAHRGGDNFYHEPPFARALRDLVSMTGSIPQEIRSVYVN